MLALCIHVMEMEIVPVTRPVVLTVAVEGVWTQKTILQELVWDALFGMACVLSNYD